jgi:hypothetical protein
VETLWGHLSGLGIRDGYGLGTKAYATSICDALGGQEECWRLARASSMYNYYLERCRGIARPLSAEKARIAERELASIVRWICLGRGRRP